jgi:hypothetical protein
VEYNASIRALVPSERLLEYEMGEDWGRLCRFLEKDVPEVPFPHKNNSTMILEGSRKQIWLIYRHAALQMLGPLAVVIAVGLGIYLSRIYVMDIVILDSTTVSSYCFDYFIFQLPHSVPIPTSFLPTI